MYLTLMARVILYLSPTLGPKFHSSLIHHCILGTPKGWVNEWMNGGGQRSHVSRFHDIVHRCTYRRMGPRIREIGIRTAQFLVDLSKYSFKAPSLNEGLAHKALLMRETGKCAEYPWGRSCVERRAIKSHSLRLQNLELFSLEKNSLGS